MPTGEPSGQHSPQDVCGQAINALLELVPVKVKIEEDMEQQEFLCRLPCTRVCSEVQKPFTELTMALNKTPGLTNDVVRQIAHVMSTLARKSKDTMNNELQRLAAAESNAEHKDTAIKLAIAARDLGGGAGDGNAFECKRKGRGKRGCRQEKAPKAPLVRQPQHGWGGGANPPSQQASEKHNNLASCCVR